MPTPIEILLDPISLIVIAMYIGLMVWEAVFPARELPYVKHWKIKGIIAFTLYFYLSSYLPLLIDPYLEVFRLFDLTSMGTYGGALIGIVLYALGEYVWHRIMHSSDFLWRTVHQMHHSAERLDTYGAFFFSPTDMIGWTLLGSVCFTIIVGLTPQAITIVLLVTNFFGIFQHANIKTPFWIGYFIQRPESHAVHHQKGLHKGNYAGLPIFDILFGTFYNPKGFESETGFYQGASDRITDMLLFRDISTEEEEKKSEGKTSKKQTVKA